MHPSASADVRGHPLHVWTEHARWTKGNYEAKNGEKSAYAEETRAGWQKYCFRQLPRASVDIRGMFGRKMEDVKL